MPFPYSLPDCSCYFRLTSPGALDKTLYLISSRPWTCTLMPPNQKPISSRSSSSPDFGIPYMSFVISRFCPYSLDNGLFALLSYINWHANHACVRHCVAYVDHCPFILLRYGHQAIKMPPTGSAKIAFSSADLLVDNCGSRSRQDHGPLRLLVLHGSILQCLLRISTRQFE